MTKREILIEMLKRYEEAQETLVRTGEGSAGYGFAMPATWNHSYRELYRTLCALRHEDRPAYRHLHARYIDPWRMRLEIKIVNGKPKLPPHTDIVSRKLLIAGSTTTITANVWPDWVDNTLVARGLDYLEREFRGEPYLPASLFEVRQTA
jgi:hypothetical protein